MVLKVIGSSSRGNGYLLCPEKGGKALMIEAGCRVLDVKKAFGFSLSRVAACLVTHEHGDHCGHARELAKAYVPLLMTGGTARAAVISDLPSVTAVETLQAVNIEEWRVLAFPTQHDAAEPCGWLMQHPECGSVLFATDTYYLQYKFAGLSNILIECNYSLDLLRRNLHLGNTSPRRYERTVKSHMSYSTCRETLLANDLSKVNNIVLVHLSADNSNSAEFARGIAEATGKAVTVAEAGMEIPFGKTPY